MISPKQVVRTGNPLVEIFLDEPAGDDSRLHDAPQAVIAGAHVKRFFAQHVRHRAAERRESRVFQHLQLKLSVTVNEIRVREKIHPVVDVNVEGTEQALVLERTTFEHLLRLDFSGVSEVVHQQSAHLPAMAHFLDHHARDGAAVPVGGSGFKKVTLLFDAGEFGIALIHDHVHQGIAHLLGRNLPQVLPLAIAFVMSELNFFGFDGAEKRVEFEAGDLVAIDANFFAPFVEETYPITESSDFCYFAGHKNLLSTQHLAVSIQPTYVLAPDYPEGSSAEC